MHFALRYGPLHWHISVNAQKNGVHIQFYHRQQQISGMHMSGRRFVGVVWKGLKSTWSNKNDIEQKDTSGHTQKNATQKNFCVIYTNGDGSKKRWSCNKKKTPASASSGKSCIKMIPTKRKKTSKKNHPLKIPHKRWLTHKIVCLDGKKNIWKSLRGYFFPFFFCMSRASKKRWWNFFNKVTINPGNDSPKLHTFTTLTSGF